MVQSARFSHSTTHPQSPSPLVALAPHPFHRLVRSSLPIAPNNVIALPYDTDGYTTYPFVKLDRNL